MSAVDFLLELYCLIDEQLQHVIPPEGLRPRGPAPRLSDAEVLTVEIAGELWGHDRDKDLFTFFCTYHTGEFPSLAHLHRSTFVRQAANLWLIAERLRERLLALLPPELFTESLFDSLAIRVCSFARAPGCKLFAGLAAFGFDHLEKAMFYGFKLHLRCGIGGPVGACQVAPANVPDVAMVPETKAPGVSVGLGDRAYWDPRMHQDLLAEGLVLVAPFRKRCLDRWPVFSRIVSRLRQKIETVLSQFVERLNIKWTWARDPWHLTHRITRKVLAHTACVWLNLQHGYRPLQFEELFA